MNGRRKRSGERVQRPEYTQEAQSMPLEGAALEGVAVAGVAVEGVAVAAESAEAAGAAAGVAAGVGVGMPESAAADAGGGATQLIEELD